MNDTTLNLSGLLLFLAFAIVIIIALPDDLELSGVFVLLPFLLLVAAGAGAVIVADKVGDWLTQRKKERRLDRALAALSMSLEEVLAEAPYRYAHWQGEDGYRIFDVRDRDGFVGFAYSEFEAKLWIVERYLADKTR